MFVSRYWMAWIQDTFADLWKMHRTCLSVTEGFQGQELFVHLDFKRMTEHSPIQYEMHKTMPLPDCFLEDCTRALQRMMAPGWYLPVET